LFAKTGKVGTLAPFMKPCETKAVYALLTATAASASQ
jgi:hypothetical protein